MSFFGSQQNRAFKAFTLVELLVVLAMVGLLAITLMPALAKTKPNTNAFQCLNNNRQLCTAWRMYADDNRERMVYSSGGDSTGFNSLDQYAWTLSNLDFNPSNRDNWDITADIVKRPLWNYTGQNASIYKCPSDKSTVVVAGQLRPRVRTMAMNVYLGGFSGSDGGWTVMTPYALYTNLVQVGGGLPTPGPAKLWVFTDERDDYVNYGNFVTVMTGYQPANPATLELLDIPGMYHHLSAGFSFADGHCEMHHWTDPRTTPPPYSVGFDGSTMVPSPRNADVSWLQDHSTRPK
jgi:prepilin-type N-terminal cleavage/methylation domain-containing protein